MTYQVSWTIEVDADSHGEAAIKALAIQRDPESIATVFEVAKVVPGGVPEEFMTVDVCSL